MKGRIITMKKKIFSVVLAAVVLLSVVLAGCGTKSGTDTTGTNTGTSGTQADYAIILKVETTDFWATMKEGILEEAKKLGVTVDVYAATSEEDTSGQLSILETCIAKGYKAIGVAPLSSTNLINGVVEASKKGIYVMNIDEKIDLDALKAAGGSVIGFATTDNVAVGKQAAEYIATTLGSNGGDVAIIEGKSGNASGESRKQGAKEGFAAVSGLKLVDSQPADWDRQKALDVAANYITMYPNLKAIYCCNDTMALGALQAVINAGKLGEILVVGTDGAAEAVTSVKAGQLSATVAQDSAEIGAESLRQMVKAVKENATIDANVAPQEINVASYVITKES